MALGTEKAEKDIMKRPPISPKKGFFSDGLLIDISLEGMLVGTLTVLAYLIGSLMFGADDGVSLGRTMAFCTLSFCEITHAVNTRSSLPLYKAGIFSNKMMNLAVAVCTLVQAAVVIIPPFAKIFGTVKLDAVQWGIVAGLSLVPLIIGEIGKTLNKKRPAQN
jgi:Ca2+-transporting ATPase